MAGKIRILIVDDAAAVRHTIKTMVEMEDDFLVVGEAADGQDAIEAVKKYNPDVVLMDINLPKLDGISATAHIMSEKPTGVIMISVEGDREYFRRAMQAGAKDYLVKPFSSFDLASAIRRVGQEFVKAAHRTPAPKVITLFSTKGGVGKSTLAANLAAAVAMHRPGSNVVLADFDVEFGTLSVMLGVKPKSTIVDICQMKEHINSTAIRNVLVPVSSTSVNLLAAPPAPHLAAEFDGEAKADPSRNYAEEILMSLREGWDFVIVDTATNFREATVAALDLADVILFITTPDIPALHNTAKGLNILLRQLEYDEKKIHIVLNEISAGKALTAEEVAHALDFPVFYTLPADEALAAAVNAGQPVLSRRTKSQAAQAIGAMAAALLDGSAVEMQSNLDENDGQIGRRSLLSILGTRVRARG